MNEPVLTLEGISKKFIIYQQQKTLFRLGRSLVTGLSITKELWALKDISLQIGRGEKIALIGRNGSGKTTLLRIIAGIYEPTDGRIDLKDYFMALFHYGTGMNVYLPVVDNIYIIAAFYGILVKEIAEKIDEILDFSGLREFMFAQVKNLSSGQMQRLLFSIFVHCRSPLLAFDESTVMADMVFRKKASHYFEQKMKSDTTMVIASHDLRFVEKHCDKVVWLNDGKIEMIDAGEKVIAEYVRYCETCRD